MEKKNRLKELLSAKHYIFRPIVDEMDAQDLRNLRQIAAGEIADISRGDRIKALRIAAHTGSQRDREILKQIIGNDSEDASLRVAAAVNMVYLPPEIAEKELLNYLEVRDNLVRSNVIKSLGMIGGPKAYEALSRLTNVKTAFIKKQLTLAKALIAYRHNLDADPLPFIEGVQREQRAPEALLKLTVKPVGTRKIGEAMKRFEGSTYGIELVKSTGFEVTAGKARWVLFINKQSSDAGIIKSIKSRKMIMGLLSRWIRETDTYSTQYIILTKPAKDSTVQIMVVRSDGEMLHSGKANIKGNIMSFTVSDIKRPGTAPTKVQGKLSLRGIELEVSIPVSKREDKRSPRTIEAEELFSKFPDKFK
jgi:hypothetical protein